METPVMKAWREFALADPEDCDREYDAYLALVNKKETTSGSSPTYSTSSLHHRAPAVAVTYTLDRARERPERRHLRFA